MRTLIPIVLMLLVTVTGCKSKPRSTAPKSTAPAKDDAVVGMVKGVNAAVKRTVTLIELSELQKTIEQAFGESDSKMPSKEYILDAMKKDNRKLYDMLQDGTIVLTETKVHESVWAYEKDAPTKGGYILTHNGPERLMTGEEVKQRLAKH